MPTHLSPSDPAYTHDARSIKRYACPACSKTWVSYADAAPFCDDCRRYSLKNGAIPEREVLEIKNTANGQTAEPIKKGRSARYEQGMVVRNLQGSVYARTGGPALHLLVNMDASAFTKGLVLVKWGELEFMSSINEINEVLRPLDPQPRASNVAGKAGQVSIDPVPRRVKAKIGPVDVDGGQTSAKFRDGTVTLRWKAQTAEISIFDLAAVLMKSL